MFAFNKKQPPEQVSRRIAELWTAEKGPRLSRPCPNCGNQTPYYARDRGQTVKCFPCGAPVPLD